MVRGNRFAASSGQVVLRPPTANRTIYTSQGSGTLRPNGYVTPLLAPTIRAGSVQEEIGLRHTPANKKVTDRANTPSEGT